MPSLRNDWFGHNWLYAGFVAGLFLFVVAPIFARAIGLTLLLVFVQLPVYMIHQLACRFRVGRVCRVSIRRVRLRLSMVLPYP